MKEQLRKVFWFVLKPFEKGDTPYEYKPLNRKLLIFAGCLFSVLSFISFYFAYKISDVGYLFPGAVFFCCGSCCLIIGLLGSERAVSTIWGNR